MKENLISFFKLLLLFVIMCAFVSVCALINNFLTLKHGETISVTVVRK